MKKITSIIFAALLVTSLVSCKKTYTCTCKTSGGNAVGPTTSSTDYANITQKDAYEACEQAEQEINDNSQIVAIGGWCSCELE